MMLKFGIFKWETPSKLFKYKIFPTSKFKPLLEFIQSEKINLNDVEKLIKYLSAFLEFDESYFQVMKKFDIKTSYLKKIKIISLQNFCFLIKRGILYK